MQRVRTIRKKQYHPRPVSAAGGLIAILALHDKAEDARPIVADGQTDLGLAYWLAFHAMVKGQSSEEVWSVVVCSLNVALVLAEWGIGAEYEPYMVKALDGAFRAKVRADSGKAWRFDGEAINAIREALEIHDEQIKLASKEQLRNALREVHRRIDAGNVYQAAA